MDTIDKKAVWPGWKTLRQIGSGSFGAVYEIEREIFGHKEKAALKVISIPKNETEIAEMRSDGYDKKSITARYEEHFRDVVREYSVMSEMKGCANIVYCDDVRYENHENGIGWDIYIKMELLRPLPEVLGDSIADEQVVRIASDMCRALACCEERNILHRDIKPQNIFVAPDGTYKLGDFGIAKTAEKTVGGTKTGTYRYMAPEVFNAQPYGMKADIYSLGLVLYWLLNRRRTPFLPLPPAIPRFSDEEEARNRRLRGDELPPPVNGSDELKRIVLKACAYDPKDRYQSANEMLLDLERIGKTVIVTPQPDVPAAPQAAPVEDAERTVSVFPAQQDKTVGALDAAGGASLEPHDDERTIGLFGDDPGTVGRVPEGKRYAPPAGFEEPHRRESAGGRPAPEYSLNAAQAAPAPQIREAQRSLWKKKDGQKKPAKLSADERAKTQTAFVKTQTAEAERLMRLAADDGIKAVCKKAYEALRYSEPKSFPELSLTEAKITVKMDDLASAVAANDPAAARSVWDELSVLISDRNRKCKEMRR